MYTRLEEESSVPKVTLPLISRVSPQSKNYDGYGIWDTQYDEAYHTVT